MKENKGTLFMNQAAMIAAIYVVLTIVLAASVSFGPVQLRICRSADDPAVILHRQRSPACLSDA